MNEIAAQWDEGKYGIQKRLGELVYFFQIGFPTNSLGVPTKLVLPAPILEDLLAYESPDDVPDQVLANASVPIEYEDGIPVIDGLPIWERLEGETIPNYKMFKEYRDMNALYGSRSVARLAETHQMPGKYLSALSKVYNWSLRCKVYDTIQKIEVERKRQYEVEKLTSRHSAVAAKMLEQGMAYLEEHPEQLNPKIALQMVETAMKAGRLALGLSPDKVGTGSEAATNINIQQNTAVAGDNSSVGASGNHGGTKSDQASADYLQSILHILDSSGALDKAKAEVIDASFEEVDD